MPRSFAARRRDSIYQICYHAFVKRMPRSFAARRRDSQDGSQVWLAGCRDPSLREGVTSAKARKEAVTDALDAEILRCAKA